MHKTTNGATPASTKLQAYQDIRRKIVRLELSPGQDLDEARLVETYGLSRTPIRELLIRLAGEGLVVLRRNRGAYVSPLSVDTLQAVFEAGDLLERAIIRLACARRDERDLADVDQHLHAYERAVEDADADAMVAANSALHEGFALASRNKYLLAGYRPILADHERIGQLWYTQNLQHDDRANEHIMRQHRELFRALVERDGDLGEQAAMEHADFCKDGIREFLASGGEILREVVLEARPL